MPTPPDFPDLNLQNKPTNKVRGPTSVIATPAESRDFVWVVGPAGGYIAMPWWWRWRSQRT